VLEGRRKHKTKTSAAVVSTLRTGALKVVIMITEVSSQYQLCLHSDIVHFVQVSFFATQRALWCISLIPKTSSCAVWFTGVFHSKK